MTLVSKLLEVVPHVGKEPSLGYRSRYLCCIEFISKLKLSFSWNFLNVTKILHKQ